MARKKTKNSLHSYERAAERLGWSKRYAKQIMSEAQTRGKTIHSKSKYGKRIKLWKGCIFVFASNSTCCITVYPSKKEENQMKKNSINTAKGVPDAIYVGPKVSISQIVCKCPECKFFRRDPITGDMVCSLPKNEQEDAECITRKQIYVFSGNGAVGKTLLTLMLNAKDTLIIDDFICCRENYKELVCELKATTKPCVVIITNTLNLKNELIEKLKMLNANVTIAEFKRA